jgi:DNA-binding NarL/FixJ family response regulator
MRIIVADGDPRTSSALRMLFACEPELEIVGETTSASRLVELAGDLEPDAILLDWEFRGRSDGAFVSYLRNVIPRAHIIAMSSRPESEREAIYAGADAFVSKAEPASALIAQVKSLVADDQIGKLARGPADDR